MVAVFLAMHVVERSIERLTGRSYARNNRSDATYYSIAFSGTLAFIYFAPDTGILLKVLAFGFAMNVDHIAGQSLFGDRGSPPTLSD